VHIKENIGETFNTGSDWDLILTFSDEQIPEQVWFLLEKKLIDYNSQINGFKTRTEIIMLESRSYIRLLVTYPESAYKLNNEQIDNTLEDLKTDFQEYYESLIERIQLIPVFA